MQSFDVFDTLIARKCIHPEAVFSMVGEDLGIPEFARMRVESERQLHGGEHQIDDIYARLRARFDLPEETLAFAKERELLHELDQVIPIARQLRQVRDGDILVSDTYLPAAFIGELLERAGLRRIVSIVRSTDGKSTGRIWRTLTETCAPDRHFGDNPAADGEMARRHGIHATITGISRPTPDEEHLLRSGQEGIALLARILRLGISEDDPVAQALLELQAGLNLPILMLANMDLRRRIAHLDRKPDRILFSSRDCRHWHRLFRSQPVPESWAAEVDSCYFLTSRVARVSSSPSYLNYFRHLASDRSLVVDLCGTGLTLAKLYAAAGLAPRTHFLYLIRGGQVTERYRAAFAGDLAQNASALIDSTNGTGNVALELMNATSHGMTIDMTDIPGVPHRVFLPRLASPEFSTIQTAWLEKMAGLVETAAEWFADPYLEARLQDDAEFAKAGPVQALLPLLRQAETSTVLAESFLQTHLDLDAAIYRQLGCPPT